MFNRSLVLYGAGSVAAFLQSLVAFSLGESGIYKYAYSSLAPSFSSMAIPHKMMWGGLFALVALFPGFKKLARGQAIVLLSVAPSVAQLFYFMPQTGAGWFGLHLGWATPVILVLLNLLWAALTKAFAGKA